MIKITFEEKIRIPVPVPLILMDIFLDAIEDLALLADLVIPAGWRKFNRGLPDRSFQDLVYHLQNSFNDMRKFGQWQLFDIRAGKIRVSAEFI